MVGVTVPRPVRYIARCFHRRNRVTRRNQLACQGVACSGIADAVGALREGAGIGVGQVDLHHVRCHAIAGDLNVSEAGLICSDFVRNDDRKVGRAHIINRTRDVVDR